MRKVIAENQRIFPSGMDQALLTACRSINHALNDGNKLLEVELPQAGLYSTPGDAEGTLEMDNSLQLAFDLLSYIDTSYSKHARMILPDKKEMERLLQMRRNDCASIRMGYLTNPNPLLDLFISTDTDRVASQCDQSDSLHVVAYPSFNVQEMLSVQQLFADTAARPPIVVLNGELDRIRSGYFPSWAYPRIARASKEFIPQFTQAFYLRNIKGARPGALFRAYPSSWKVVRHFANKPSQVIEEHASMPSLQYVSLTALHRS